MSSAAPIDLRCRIDSLSDPVAGRVSDGRGRSVPFRGWIEFAAALTSLAEGLASQQSHSPEKEKEDE